MNVATNAIGEMIKRNATVINLKKSAEDEYMDKLDKAMKSTVWGAENCNSYYANQRGDVTVIWPKSTLSYWWETRKVDWSKFDFLM